MSVTAIAALAYLAVAIWIAIAGNVSIWRAIRNHGSAFNHSPWLPRTYKSYREKYGS